MFDPTTLIAFAAGAAIGATLFAIAVKNKSGGASDYIDYLTQVDRKLDKKLDDVKKKLDEK